MKKYLFLLLGLLLISTVFSQERQHARQEKTEAVRAKMQERKGVIAAQKAAYITAKVGMSQDQAEKFWPVYNKFRAELESSRKSLAKDVNMRKPIDERTDEELKEMLDKRFVIEEEKLKIEMRYHKEFLKLLSVKQVAKLYKAEDEFKKEIIKELKSRKR